MIRFMGHTASLEVHDVESELSAVNILGPHDHSFGAFDFEVDAWKAQAALLTNLFALPELYHRIDQNDFVLRIFPRTAIHHKQTLQEPHLRRCQAHTRCSVHGIKHVIDKAAQLFIELLNLAGPFGEDRITVFDNVQYHRCISSSLFLASSSRFSTSFSLSS